jgi:hypothetical protein
MDTRSLVRRAGVAVGAYALFVRPKMLHWGATKEEVDAHFPVEELLPGGHCVSTMAATLDAPPRKIFPWLLQMGYDKGGWYSWDMLDNLGKPSVDRLHPEWTQVKVGDVMYGPSRLPVFEVVALEPNRFLALRTLFGRRDRQHEETDGIWAFELKELEDDGTRLIVRTIAPTKFHWPNSIVDFVFWQPAHWIMQMRQFQNLERLTSA